MRMKFLVKRSNGSMFGLRYAPMREELILGGPRIFVMDMMDFAQEFFPGPSSCFDWENIQHDQKVKIPLVCGCSWWNLGYQEFGRIHPGWIIVRVSSFGRLMN